MNVFVVLPNVDPSTPITNIHPTPNNEMNAGMGCDCADDLLAQKEKNKLLQEEMESTLQDIQNM